MSWGILGKAFVIAFQGAAMQQWMMLNKLKHGFITLFHSVIHWDVIKSIKVCYGGDQEERDCLMFVSLYALVDCSLNLKLLIHFEPLLWAQSRVTFCWSASTRKWDPINWTFIFIYLFLNFNLKYLSFLLWVGETSLLDVKMGTRFNWILSPSVQLGPMV